MKRALFLVSLVAASGCHVRNDVYNPVPRSIVALETDKFAASIAKPGEKADVPVDTIDPGCVPALRRPCLAFIEFDEMGEFWNPDQVKAATDLVKRSPRNLPPPLVIAFVHGWKNNASDGWKKRGGDYVYQGSRKNGNVLGFEGVLEYLAKDEAISNTRPIVGIFLGWRGDFISKYWPIARQFSYFNRERTAIRIPGADMTEALTRVMLDTRASREDSTIVMVGHSFGALVLERALTQAMTDYVLRTEAGARPDPTTNIARADLVIFVNSAAAASEGKQMMDVLKRVEASHPAAPEFQRPLFLSISSLGDAATRFAMPVGHGPSFLGYNSAGSWRKYDPPDAAGVTDQKDYYLHTAAHMPALKSHLVIETLQGARSDECGSARVIAAFSLKNGKAYKVCENPAPHWNDTRYWAMQMPASIVRDHSGIFNLNFVTLLVEMQKQAGK